MRYGIMFLVIATGTTLLIIWLVQMLWNVVVPGTFHGPALSYGQAAAIFALAKLLFSDSTYITFNGSTRR